MICQFIVFSLTTVSSAYQLTINFLSIYCISMYIISMSSIGQIEVCQTNIFLFGSSIDLLLNMLIFSCNVLRTKQKSNSYFGALHGASWVSCCVDELKRKCSSLLLLFICNANVG